MIGIYLETDRLLLRPFSLSDADDLHRIWTEPAVRKYLWDDLVIPRDTVVEVIEASLKSFAEYGFGFWTICIKDKPDTIGFCGLRHFQDPETERTEVELLYGLLPEHWGIGLATESANEVLRYGFQQVALETIYAGADPPNEASFKVMERLGMKFLRRMTINGLVAVYYVMRREQFQSNEVTMHDQDS